MKILSVKVSNEILQWIGALAIIAGHGFNTLIEFDWNVRPWNIAAFGIGTVFFFIWSLRVRNRPQIVVNIVALTVCLAGLYRAIAN